jgi:hypothetical protein
MIPRRLTKEKVAMLEAGRRRAEGAGVRNRVAFVRAPMDRARPGAEPEPLTEYNRPVPGRTLTRGGPVIYEGTFRAVGRS